MLDLIAELNRNDNDKYIEGLELLQTIEEENSNSSKFCEDIWDRHIREEAKFK